MSLVLLLHSTYSLYPTTHNIIFGNGHKRTHTHIYKHTHMHIYMYIYTHTLSLIHTHTHTHTHKHTGIATCLDSKWVSMILDWWNSHGTYCTYPICLHIFALSLSSPLDWTATPSVTSCCSCFILCSSSFFFHLILFLFSYSWFCPVLLFMIFSLIEWIHDLNYGS